MYRVYLARKKGTDYEFALKVMNEDYIRETDLNEVLNEVDVLTHLDHPYIAR